MNTLNLTIGNENDVLYSREITGVAYIVVVTPLRFITNDMQRETSEKNQSNGSFQSANLAMTNSIGDL